MDNSNGPNVPPNTPANGKIPVQRSVFSPPNLPVSRAPNPPPPAPPSTAPAIGQRVAALPLVACSIQVYDDTRKKGNMLSLGLMCSEIAVGLATLPVRAVAAPLAMLCPWPVRIADYLLCLGLDFVEMFAPCIKGPPRKMCRPVRICYRNSRNRIQAIPGLMWMTANELFSTPCGQLLMTSADRLIISVDGCINVVLPSSDSPKANALTVLMSSLARLPIKTARQIYDALFTFVQYIAERSEVAEQAAAAFQAAEAAAAAARRRKKHSKYYNYYSY